MSEVRLCLFGAAGDTGNLGVSALRQALLVGLLRRLPDAHITAFDHGRGMRDETVEEHGEVLGSVACRGAVLSKRLTRGESWATIRAALRLAPTRNAVAAELDRATAVLDISAGDSFSDLYGLRRFRSVHAPKAAARSAAKPLFLLPQTYGPFRVPVTRAVARATVAYASLAWARDPRSFERLVELAGGQRTHRLRSGVDVAFLLRAERPPIETALRAWLDRDDGTPLVGVNVSGLLSQASRQAGSLRQTADYREAMRRLLQRFLDRTSARVLLVPHVLGTSAEADRPAAKELVTAVGATTDRVKVAPEGLSAVETKWLIGRTDWFCGARMHACIAALSQGVPTAGVAYSAKAAGVFETVGAVEHVADGRELDTSDLVDRLWDSWQVRQRVQQVLSSTVPGVEARAAALLDELAERIEALA